MLLWDATNILGYCGRIIQNHTPQLEAGKNVLFIDGSVRWLNLNQLYFTPPGMPVPPCCYAH